MAKHDFEEILRAGVLVAKKLYYSSNSHGFGSSSLAVLYVEPTASKVYSLKDKLLQSSFL